MVLPMESPVEQGDELWFYYGGFRLNHHSPENPCCVGLMTAERDRLIGVRPITGDPGVIMTRPVPVAGARLTINARVAGSITAELRTDDNQPVPGFRFDDCIPVTESGFSARLAWNSGELARSPEAFARIVFRLHDVELFTFALQ
jgi:hypothetical protein